MINQYFYPFTSDLKNFSFSIANKICSLSIQPFIIIVTICLIYIMTFDAQGFHKSKTGKTQAESAGTPANIQATISRITNKACQDEDKVYVNNLRHKVHFTPEGISFSPSGNELIWKWSLDNINGIECQSSEPELFTGKKRSYVDYDRGDVTERYLLHGNSVEQLFIIHSISETGNLCIEGNISSGGNFQEKSNGWKWTNGKGGIKLGQIYVFDATGKSIAANFHVESDFTRIEIADEDIRDAVLPITIDPEIGADFRLSDMGSDNQLNSINPRAVHNFGRNEYLVVWEADVNSGLLVDDEFEIYGQIVNEDGTANGSNFRISQMGPDGSADYDAVDPSVAYNSTDREYMVIWSGSDDSGSLEQDEFEIWGQRINRFGALQGGAVRYSSVGADGNADRDANTPDIAYNSVTNEFLIVWSGDDMSNDEFEIYGQVVQGDGSTEVADLVIRISDMGPDGDAGYDAIKPAIAYNSTNDNYMVVWRGDDNINSINNENEIFGQRVRPDGTEAGDNDFRISHMGPDNDEDYDAETPAIAFNSGSKEFLVVWNGDSDSPTVDGEQEIWGQIISRLGEDLTGDFRISEMATDGLTNYRAFKPSAVFNNSEEVYLVTWTGESDDGLLVDEKFEMYGQLIDPFGSDYNGTNDFRITFTGLDSDLSTDAVGGFSVYNSVVNEFFVSFQRDDNIGDLVQEKDEIYGQRLDFDGNLVGSAARLSFLDVENDSDFDASDPAIAYNSTDNNYLAVWSANHFTEALDVDEFEIYGQFVDFDGSEFGANFRISAMGPDGEIEYNATQPALAYNSDDNEFMVVWRGDDDSHADQAFEIWGARVSLDGTDISVNSISTSISNMGTDDTDASCNAEYPDIAYNTDPGVNQYLVVWSGDDDGAGLADNEFEIFGQVIEANGDDDGAVIRISSMGGTDGDNRFNALNPTVACSSTTGRYLVVWSGDDDTGSLVDDEFEIHGQLVRANGGLFLENFRISDMGNTDGTTNYKAEFPDVTFNSLDNRFLVVWSGSDDTGSLEVDEFEIYGQLINNNGDEDDSDFRISDMGNDGSPGFDAEAPAVSYNSVNNEFMVIWSGDDNINGLVNNEYEIFGQRVDGFELLIGPNTRFSDMGPNGSNDYDAFFPAIAYNSTNNQYLTVWSGDDDTGALVDGEFEIFASLLPGDETLPVELLEFKAFVQDAKVELTWQTASEINNDFFTIERSADKIHFDEIAHISGQGNSDILSSYDYTDETAPKGDIFYRLKQTDYDGSFAYSNIVWVNVSQDEIREISLYPNPVFNEKLFVEMDGARDADVTAEILDIQGKRYFLGNVNLSSDNFLEIGPEYINGIYIFRLRSQNEIYSKRFVVSGR